MPIPYSFNPLGSKENVIELSSCGISDTANVYTGVTGQTRNMKYVLHVGDVPLDGVISSRYVQVIGCDGGCRRYIRFIEGISGVYSGSASDSMNSIRANLREDMMIEVDYRQTDIMSIINGEVQTAQIKSFDEPLGEIKMFWYSNLQRSVVFRFYYAQVYLDNVLVSHIVPAMVDEKLVLYDKVRRLKIEPTGTPLVP